MTPFPHAPSDDLAAVRALLGPADPVPDPTLAREDVLAARAAVGLARADGPVPATRGPRGRLVAAGAVALLSVVALVALVAVPPGRNEGTVALVTGPGARAVSSAYAATARSGTARGLLTVTDGGNTVTATGVGDLGGGDAQAEIALVGAGAPAAQILVVRTGEAIFAKLPPGTNPLATDRPWVSVDAATLTRLTQLALGDIAGQVAAAPLDALAYLNAVSGDVQVVGPDTTRGEATTHYRGTVDPRKVAEQLPAAVRPDAARAAGEVGQALPADLWIDGQGRLRRLVLMAEPASIAGGAGGPPATPGGTVTITLELWDFGTTVEVTPPPPDQVVDVGGLLGGFLNGARRP